MAIEIICTLFTLHEKDVTFLVLLLLQIYEKSAKPMKSLKNCKSHLALTQPAFTCSKLTVETLGQGVKYVTPCSSVSIVNFEHVITGWALNSPEMSSTCNFSLYKLYSHSLLP